MNLQDIVREGMRLSGATVVEIGALYRPFVRKSEADVIYVDHADTETLRDKYRTGHGFDVNEIVEVDAVWGANTLQECLGVDRKVDYVLASHVIEHVPDLLTWLAELRSVLKPGGEIRLVVPDKRFTFDYVRRETALQDVIEAYARRARRPLPSNIFDHVNYVRKVDTGAAWAAPLDPASLEPIYSFDMAIELVQDALATENYHDVHCWVFTPRSFGRLMLEAARLGLTDLECSTFRDTPHFSIEFTVFVRPSADRAAIEGSWRRMAEAPDEWDGEPAGQRIAGLEAGIAAREAEIATKAAEITAKAAEIIAKAEEIDAQAAALAAKESAIAELQAQNAEFRQTVAALRASTSWRVTAPLRKISGLLR